MALVPLDPAQWYTAAYGPSAVTPTTTVAPLGLFARFALPDTLPGRPEHEVLFLTNQANVTRAGVRVYVSMTPTDDVTGLAVGDQELALGIDTNAAFDFTTATSPTRAVVPPALPTPNPPAGSPPWTPLLRRLHMVPSGITFSVPTTAGAGLVVGDLGPYQCRAVWLRWSIPAAANPRARVRTRVAAVYDDGT